MEDSINVKQALIKDPKIIETIGMVASKEIECINGGGKLIICGNGGSASDALHFAGEIVGRFEKERNAWPAVVLNSDVATMTAISNDYGYDDVFSRQVEAWAKKSDVFIGISTSGNSKNVLKAMKKAKELGAVTVGLLGKDGGQIKDIADHSIVVPSDVTARIQESHIMIIHIMCELIENGLSK